MMKKSFYLSTLIRRLLEKEGGASRLARLIKAANDQVGEKKSVGHRTLKKLAYEPEHVQLSYTQLVALDNYLSSVGEGLDRNPIFHKRGVLDCLVETPRVAFLLGSTPRQWEQRNDVSRWDTRSVARLLHEICLRSAALQAQLRGVEFEFADVLLDFPVRLEKLATEPWYQLLEDQQCSVIAFGSSRACHASEIMLAQMFGVTPFHKPSLTDPLLPFYFIWPGGQSGESGRSAKPRLKGNPPGFQSHFAWTPDDIEEKDPALARAIRRGKAFGFYFDGKLYPVSPGPGAFPMYAVIAAQRRSGSQVHVVIAGISGPATHAAATLVRKITAALPHVPGEDSQVLYVPVETQIRTDPSRSRRGDVREVLSCRFLCPPKWWPAPVGGTTDPNAKR